MKSITYKLRENVNFLSKAEAKELDDTYQIEKQYYFMPEWLAEINSAKAERDNNELLHYLHARDKYKYIGTLNSSYDKLEYFMDGNRIICYLVSYYQGKHFLESVAIMVRKKEVS